jgi:predicted transcriptional regulator
MVGTLDVPAPSVAFTVKLPVSLLHRLRTHARDSGRTLSGIVAQAIEEFLERVRAGPRGG